MNMKSKIRFVLCFLLSTVFLLISANLAMAAQPDLVIQGMTASKNPLTEYFDLNVVVKNQGDAAAGGFYIDIAYNPPVQPFPPGYDPFATNRDNSWKFTGLAAGAQATATFENFTNWYFYRPGQPLYAQIDGDSAVAESNESNNVFGPEMVNFSPTANQTPATDNQAPATIVTAPSFSTGQSKTTTFKVSWTGSDPAPSSGIASYDVQYKIGKGGTWTNWQTGTSSTSANFKGEAGRTYYFKAKARDSAGNIGAFSTETKTIVPYDQTAKAILKNQSGFSAAISSAKSAYFLGTARYSKLSGDQITYAFSGNSFALVADKGKGRGKAAIYVDGKYKKTIDTLATSTKYRQVVYSISFTKIGKHTVKVVNKGTPGRPRLTLDAAAVGR